MVKITDLIIPKFLDEAASPIAREAGDRLADIVNLLFTPIYLARRYKDLHVESFLRKTEQALLKVNEKNNICYPPANIVGPALEHVIKFGYDQEYIQDLFAQLIATSMSTNSEAHPAFVEIIKQLSVSDAALLNSDYFYKIESNLTDDEKSLNNFATNIIPLCDIVYRHKINKQIDRYICTDFIHPKRSYSKMKTEDFMFSIQNLMRLNLISIDFEKDDFDFMYEEYQSDDLLGRYNLYENIEPHIIKKRLSLTQFGERFIRAVIKI